jgi:hypothetical protein
MTLEAQAARFLSVTPTPLSPTQQILTAKNAEITSLAKSCIVHPLDPTIETSKAKPVIHTLPGRDAKRIERGRQIATLLLNTAMTPEEIETHMGAHTPKARLELRRTLVHFIMDSAQREYTKNFTRGVARLDVTDMQGRKLQQFFDTCPGSYERRSSHFKGLSEPAQRGLDFNDGNLPLGDPDLKTMLYRQLPDGFFIKLERFSFSLRKPIQCIMHLWALRNRSKIRAAEASQNIVQPREDQMPSAIKEAYKKVITEYVAFMKGQGLEINPAFLKCRSRANMIAVVKKIQEGQTATDLHPNGLPNTCTDFLNQVRAQEKIDIKEPETLNMLNRYGQEVLFDPRPYLVKQCLVKQWNPKTEALFASLDAAHTELGLVITSTNRSLATKNKAIARAQEKIDIATKLLAELYSDNDKLNPATFQELLKIIGVLREISEAQDAFISSITAIEKPKQYGTPSANRPLAELDSKTAAVLDAWIHFQTTIATLRST